MSTHTHTPGSVNFGAATRVENTDCTNGKCKCLSCEGTGVIPADPSDPFVGSRPCHRVHVMAAAIPRQADSIRALRASPHHPHGHLDHRVPETTTVAQWRDDVRTVLRRLERDEPDRTDVTRALDKMALRRPGSGWGE